MQLENLRTKRKQDDVDPSDLRLHCVSVRLNYAELEALNKFRGKSRRGEALRMLAFTNLPTPIPEFSQSVWADLGRATSNLNQIARKMNSGENVGIDEIKLMISELREILIGAKS